MFEYYGLLAAACVVVANIKYMHAVYSGKCRPSLSASLVFLCALSLILLSSIRLGTALSTVYIVAANLIMNVLILLMILKFPWCHRKLRKNDMISIGFLLVATLVGYVFDFPLMNLLMPSIVGIYGTLLVVQKLHSDHGSEDTFTWLVASIGYVFSLAGTDVLRIENIAFTGASLCLCLYISLLTYKHRHLDVKLMPQ